PRLFSNETLRLFDGEAVHFACRCGRERVGAMLKGLGRNEVDSVLAEQGAVTVTCEFCQRPYRFDAVDIQQLFLESPGSEGSERLN
ncbi:MAG TPA: Hsp33 family molecular chaperone HslO, partial [Steroidobacteraceae bacterium]|nr:Hsp33 family molecular chaperone HslO [Steroidobacteraceae bacterium]